MQGVFWGVLSALLFALRNLLQKYRFSSVPSDSLMFHQVVAVALMLLPWAAVPQLTVLAPDAWLMLLLLGVLSTAVAHTLYAAGLKRLPAKTAALIGCLQPVIASVLAWLVISEAPPIQVVIGGGIILTVAICESTQKS